MQARVTVHTILSEHIKRYSEELQQKLGDLKASYEATYSNQELTNILRTQVKVLEGQWEALTALEEELQKRVPFRLNMP